MHEGNDPRVPQHRTIIGFQVIPGIDGHDLVNRFAFHIFRHHSLIFWNNGIRHIEFADLRPVDVSWFTVWCDQLD